MKWFLLHVITFWPLFTLSCYHPYHTRWGHCNYFFDHFSRYLVIIIVTLLPSDGATAAEFSHSDNYPTLVRVVPSDAYQGTVIADLISKLFGWKRVIAWASSDSLGADTLLEFELSCKTSVIDVVKSLQFAPGDNDFTELLNEAKPYDVRIFAFLITNVADASNLLVQGFDSGVFNTLTMFFFTTSLQVNDNPMSVPQSSNNS